MADTKEMEMEPSADLEARNVSNENVNGIEHETLLVSDKLDTEAPSDTPEGPETNGCSMAIEKVQSTVSNFFSRHKSIITKAFWILLTLLYSAFLIYACYLDIARARVLIILTCLTAFVLLYKMFRSSCTEKFRETLYNPVKRIVKPMWNIIKWVLIVMVVVSVVVAVAVLIGKNTSQYRGLLGLVFFTSILFLTSHNPSKVKLRPVLWGMLLNFIFALIILKSKEGSEFFKLLADQITAFLGYTNAGAKFIFGSYSNSYDYTTVFAFSILPTIVFFSCVISLLYYIGVMQAVIEKIALVMQLTMGTSATESLSCAGNIFVGQTEAPILVRPFLPHMTNSELTAVMTGGFATIAGGVLAAFIGMGIDPVHLIAASVMNAPMALAVSKLTYPETEKAEYVTENKIKFAKPTEQNAIEAAAAGASQSIGLVANIAANLIAFLSLLAFLNAALHWIGSFVDYPELSFELICSYLFWVVAYFMGVDRKDCFVVAELIGTKIVINEFVAYEKLGDIIKNKATCVEPYISKKSEIIATYALCGFANLSSMGMQIGGIGAMAPNRKSDLAKLVGRALFAGAVATLMTANIAGLLLSIEEDDNLCTGNITTPAGSYNGTTLLNATAIASVGTTNSP
ncbi:hypothetical protein EB796_021948 [Bugula neritina]|uniref:Sodium/nucleoside cotransporter n=1 Tax=Bugula neritina TaxID=10212 RepID=A0A7J7J0L6_BUGNE|nr:hypothetical protein EB796_021948 [Bugula neritina]